MRLRKRRLHGSTHLRLAELNSSAEEVLCEVYRVWTFVIPTMTAEKKRPMPIYRDMVSWQFPLRVTCDHFGIGGICAPVHLRRRHSRRLAVRCLTTWCAPLLDPVFVNCWGVRIMASERPEDFYAPTDSTGLWSGVAIRHAPGPELRPIRASQDTRVST